MTTNVSPAVLQPGTSVGTIVAPYLIGQANAQTIIKRAVFSNTGTVANSLTVYRVPNGGTAAVGNEIIPARSIAGGATDLAPELSNMVLNGGDSIQALVNVGTVEVNVFASGFIATG